MNPKEVGYEYLEEKYHNQFIWTYDTTKYISWEQQLSHGMLFCITDNMSVKHSSEYEDFN